MRRNQLHSSTDTGRGEQTAFKPRSSPDCVFNTDGAVLQRRPSRASIRGGVHAYDRSYSQLFFTDGRAHVNISLEVSGGQELQLRARNVGGGGVGGARQAVAGPVTLFIEALTTWRFGNDLALVAGDALQLNSPGSSNNSTLVETDGKATSTAARRFAGLSPAHVTVDLSAVGSVARFSTSVGMTSAALDSRMASARAAEESTYSKFGPLGRVSRAAQAAAMWNVKWNPLEYGPFAPPAPWDFVTQGTDPDFGYTLFDW